MGWFSNKNNNDFSDKVKRILKNNSLAKMLSQYYNIPMSDIDTHLKIEVADLDGKFAEGNGKVIRIDKKLLNKDFFKINFHFIAHEFFHWLKRRSEKEFYFNDPEEIQGFIVQMAWEIMDGKNEKDIRKSIYPIIRSHFKDDAPADSLFDTMLRKAKFICKKNG